LQVEESINDELSDEITATSSVADLVLQATGGAMPQSSAEVKAVLEMLPEQTRSNYVDDDFTAANMVLGVEIMESGMDIEGIKQLKTELEGYAAERPEGVSVAVTGMLMLEVELWSAITGGRIQMTLIGVGLIFAGLLLFFRFNLIRALLCTLPVGLIIGWSTGFMYVAGLKFNPATATIGALIMGIGVEFTILLMMRYYEERGRGEAPRAAMTTAMTKIGRAIGVSGLTTMGGFAALMVAVDFPILRDFGILTVADVFFALISTLLVLAPLIVWVDSMLDRRKRRKRHITQARGQEPATQA
jgi:predicted RND superfamily exporter protein